VRHQEEVKAAVNNLTLFHKALVDVGTLRWVIDECLSIVALSLLEEALTDPLVDNDECDLGAFNLVALIVGVHAVFLLDDLVQLL
jgi:hypothetical protein